MERPPRTFIPSTTLSQPTRDAQTTDKDDYKVWTSHDAETCECCVDFWLGAQHPVKDDSDNDSGYCSVTQNVSTVEPDPVPVIKVTPLTNDEVLLHNTCVRILYNLRMANLVPYNASPSSLDPSPYSTNASTAAGDTQDGISERTRERNFPQKTLYVPQETHTKRLKDTWENRSIWPFLFEAPYTTTPYSTSPPSPQQSIYGSSFTRANASSVSLDRYNARRKSWGLASMGVELHPAMMSMQMGPKRSRGLSVDAHSRNTRRVPTATSTASTTTTTTSGIGMDKRRMSVDSFVSSTSTVDRSSWHGSSRASSPVSTASSSSSEESTRPTSKPPTRTPSREALKSQNRTPSVDASKATQPPGVDASKSQIRTPSVDASKNQQTRTLSVDANGIATWRSTSPYIYATPSSSRLDSNSSLSSVSTSNHYTNENVYCASGAGKRRLVRGGAVKRPYSMISTSNSAMNTGSLPSLPTSKTFGTRMESTTSLASVASSTSTHHHKNTTTTENTKPQAATPVSTPTAPATPTPTPTASRGKQFKSLSTDQLVSPSSASNSGGSGGEKTQGRRSGFGRLKNFVGGLYSTAPSSFRL